MWKNHGMSFPKLLKKRWSESLGRMLPSKQSVPKSTAGLGLGARPLSLVLKWLRSLRPASLSHQQATATPQFIGREVYCLFPPLWSLPQGTLVHQEFVHVSGKWVQHHLCLSLPPHPLIHRNSEIVESKGYRTRIFPLPYYSRTPKNE